MSFQKVSLVVVVFILSMLSLNPAHANERFSDVPSSHGAYEDISYLVNLGVIKGYTEEGKTSFKPNASVTRGQAAKMVIVATKNKPITVQKSSFSDITLGTELSGYVESAIKLGIFSEQTKGKFGPNVPLTRDEMSKVLAVAFNLDVEKYAKLTIPYTDISTSNSYYKYIAAIYYNGIAVEANKYNANQPVKRSQFASFVARANSETHRLDLPVQGVTVPNTGDAVATVKASVDNLNVRSSSSSAKTDNILGKVNMSTVFPVFEVQKDGWLKVAYNGRYAYIYKDYVKFVDETGGLIGAVQKQVNASAKLSIYQNRDATSKIIGNVAEKEAIAVYGTVGNWYVTMIDGMPGYVRISQTQEIVVAPPVEEKPPVVVKPPTVIVEEEQDTGNVDEVVEPTPPDQQLLTGTIGKATLNNLHIRETASGSSKSVGKLSRGTLVEVHSISGSWVKVTSGSIKGYVNKTYLQLLNQQGTAVAGRIIVLDPGHGGKDPGAVRKDAIEKTIALTVANAVKQKLEKDGAIVKMTRTGDTYPSLTERVQYAKNQYGEIFVSIHANAATNASAKGTETYYSVSSNDNEKEDYALASAINKEIVKNASMNNRGVKRADYVVVKGLLLPSVLVELGFLTNSEDYAKLTDEKYLEIYAQSIYNGIVEYYTK